MRQLLGVAATGYILLFFSEHLFWTRAHPGTVWLEYVATYLAYTVLAYVLLALVHYFRARTVWALFLCGAVYGWLAEGVLVQTLYENLPLSVSWTGLAWHAILSVWLGLYAVPRALRAGPRPTALLAAIIGLFYGLWAMSWWSEPGGRAAPLEFGLFATGTSLLLVFAYGLSSAALSKGFNPNRVADIGTGSLLLLYFIVTLPTAPIAALVLPALLSLVLLALRRNRRAETGAATLSPAPAEHVPLLRYFALLLIPVVATAFYSVAYSLQWREPVNVLLYLVLTPLGFLLLLLSLWRVGRRQAGGLPRRGPR